MKIEPFNAGIAFKFGVSVRHDEAYNYDARQLKNMELYNWCLEQFGNRKFTKSFNTFYFNTEAQRNWFIMRWS
jgi:hypothetical protein